MIELHRFRMRKLQIKNRFSNFLDALMRRDIIKTKLCVKPKKIIFLLFFSVQNIEIHKAFDSNEIEIISD